MQNNKVLNVLGCVPELLNILFELADEAVGFKNFNIYKNIPVQIDENFIPLQNWNIEELLVEGSLSLSKSDVYALSVVGTKSKEIVFNAFRELIGYNKKQFINLIHPSSYVSSSVQLSYGLQLEPLSTIAACTKIGFAVNIKRNSNIGHHCILNDYVSINPGVTLSSKVIVGTNTIIGSGASIKDNITIGKNCIIGVGSVVVKDIPSNSIAFGNPCKVHQPNP